MRTPGRTRKEGPVRDKSGVYHYRRRIPEDIRRILRRLDAAANTTRKQRYKLEEKKRLGRDADRAAVLWMEYDREVEARWQALREEPQGSLTVVQREALAGDVYRAWLQRFPPEHVLAQQNAALMLGALQQIDGEVPWPDRDWNVSDEELLEGSHGRILDEILGKRGLILHGGARMDLLMAANRAAKHACRFALRRFEGDLRPDPEAARYPEWPDPRTTTLLGLHELWAKWRRPNDETKRAFLSSIEKLIAFVGHGDVTRLTTEGIRRWCSSLKQRTGGDEIGGIRIRDGYLAAVKAVLNSAVTQGYLKSNPAAGVKVDVERTEEPREKDLRDAEIYAILRGSLGAFDSRVSEDVQNARRWVPWLCAYTGARVSELTSLESRHIVCEEGIDAIHIETSKTGRPRKIPVHRDLRAQGFLEFVASRRGRPLFFDEALLSKGRRKAIHRTRAEGIAEWVRTLDAMKNSEVAPNHGWRHRFRTECRRIFMDPTVRRYLQGHAMENVGDEYGHVPLDVSAPWMEMFPIFDVSGAELVVHRKFDLSQLMQAASRMAAMRSAKEGRILQSVA